MTETASDFLIRRISEWGVRRIYGYPGDGINGIIGAIETPGDAIEYVQVRHEEMAAFMACAHAKFTGEVGICLATSGPGASKSSKRQTGERSTWRRCYSLRSSKAHDEC
jgi:pyruvate dehydrogenase (quinone)